MAKQRRKRAAPAFPPHPVVAVEWLDASFQDGPLSAVDFDGRVRLLTVGWLVVRDDETITVAQEMRQRENGTAEYRAWPISR